MSIDAYKFTGRKTHTISNERKTVIGRGKEDKWLVEGEMHFQNRSKDISLIERNPLDRQTWIYNWKILKEAGLPVPPTLRIADNGNLLVTNFKANGGEMYGKGLFLHFQELKEFNEPYTYGKTDDLFLEIIANQSSALEAEVDRLLVIANQHKIALSVDDAFELLIQPNGEWKIVITDLMEVSTTKTKEEVEKNNSQAKVNFFDYHHIIKNKLQQFGNKL